MWYFLLVDILKNITIYSIHEMWNAEKKTKLNKYLTILTEKID